MNDIISGYETRTHRYETKSKQLIMQWKHTNSHVSKKFRLRPLAEELIVVVSADYEGPACAHFL